MSKRTGSRRAKAGRISTRYISPRQIAARLVRQREQARFKRQLNKVKNVISKFRVRKADRGRLIMVGVSGQRDPQAKGRKGFLVYVTKTGKKQITRYGSKREWLLAKKITDIEIPIRKNLRNAVREFQATRRVLVSKHRAAVKQRGSVGKIKGSGGNDFSEKVVDKMAGSLGQAFRGQASQRSFLVSSNVLVNLPDGRKKVYQIQTPIARPDHLVIKVGGLKNFIRHKFYAFMARELAFDGFVTSGSANHMRRLKQNKGKTVSQWRQTDGEMWRGNESTIVKIINIEWKIEQIK